MPSFIEMVPSSSGHPFNGYRNLKVVAYNVQMTPGIFTLSYNTSSRVEHLISTLKQIIELKNPDVMILCEVFSSRANDLLHSSSKQELQYPYQTSILRSSFHSSIPHISSREDNETSNAFHNKKFREVLVNSSDGGMAMTRSWDSISGNFHKPKVQHSGLKILSKYPIVSCHGYLFHHAAFPDCFSSKGAIFVQIDKCGQKFNIVGTHLQAGESKNEVRLKQIAELAEWLELYPLHPTGISILSSFKTIGINAPSDFLSDDIPLIFGGDFNVRYNEDKPYFQKILGCNLLNAIDALPIEFAHTTYDTQKNDLCFYEEGRPSIPKRQILDYLLLSKIYGGSVKTKQESIQIPLTIPIFYRHFKFGFIPWKSTTINHFSDHFPICGTFSADNALS
ncbi:endonuclease/exonuclease/phosphatase family protein [Cardiosporidium cionae]|uniref:sphingomyelin phosphodiesterase n=1 Tax=Cardiosporidium cionae TaxID=476202 RepID=A0ABQ7JCG4_9APIC|nr:endonuclease/exonuclease/phosphatase family protein [Cardiosporidium cionae]|eukprot:KAF8821579.1 endonuclease/exonuclease/phosphatase family protein [Cardiosporidium cionae]